MLPQHSPECDSVVLDFDFYTFKYPEITIESQKQSPQLWSYADLNENPDAQTIVNLIDAIVLWLHRPQWNETTPDNG